ncbi:MAG: DUF1846 family protein, partial [Clostridia bacterium]
LRVMGNLREIGLYVSSVVITLFNNQPSAKLFANRLMGLGEKVYLHKATKGYPTDVNLIVSEEGYGANPYIETTRSLVVIAAPGPGSGKLATCLSQLYHEYKRGNKAGYAKFETFPVWNLELENPINVAYEAATADLKDINSIDPFHFNAYGKVAINYNRDIEAFPVVKNILSKIMKGDVVYKSPTDMGVNMLASAITDSDVVNKAARAEIVRRYFRTSCDYKKGICDKDTAERVELLMQELEIVPSERKCVLPAIDASMQTNSPVIAIELANGRVVTGRTKKLIGASAAVVLNALKILTGIEDPIDLIPPSVLEPILHLKSDILKIKYGVLNLKDVLLALSISALSYPEAKRAFDAISELSGCQGHSSNILNPSDEDTFRRLNLDITSEPQFLSKNLFEI